MKTLIRSAVGDAMARLASADVAGATAAIQRALSGQEPPTRTVPPEGPDASRPSRAASPRGLGEVLRSLREGRGRLGVRPFAFERGVDGRDGSGDANLLRFTSAAGSLGYRLHAPADHAMRERALVLMLHGCTQDPDDFARGTRMSALADEFGLIVAYPHQPRSANAQGCWNWFDRRHQGREAGEPAVLAGLARELASRHGIAPGRIFVAGLSAGAAMADVLASTHPDLFAAAGIHSGLACGAASDVMSAFAAMKGQVGPRSKAPHGSARRIIFHGGADATVHPSNGDALLERARRGRPGMQEIATTATIDGRRVERTLLGPEAGPTVAEYWAIESAGHAWSGGDPSGSFTDPKGPDASREMIRFFLET